MIIDWTYGAVRQEQHYQQFPVWTWSTVATTLVFTARKALGGLLVNPGRLMVR